MAKKKVKQAEWLDDHLGVIFSHYDHATSRRKNAHKFRLEDKLVSNEEFCQYLINKYPELEGITPVNLAYAVVTVLVRNGKQLRESTRGKPLPLGEGVAAAPAPNGAGGAGYVVEVRVPDLEALGRLLALAPALGGMVVRVPEV